MDDDAIHGREDVDHLPRVVADRDARCLDQSDLVTGFLVRLHRLPVTGFGLAVDLDGNESVFEELALGLVVLPGVLEVDRRRLALIAHREEVLRLVDVRLDAGDELALPHDITGAHRQVDNPPGEVGLDLHLDFRFDRADLAHHHLNVVDRRRQGRNLGTLLVLAVAGAPGSRRVCHCSRRNHDHGDDDRRHLVFDLSRNKNDPFLQKARKNIIPHRAAGGCFFDTRDHKSGFVHHRVKHIRPLFSVPLIYGKYLS